MTGPKRVTEKQLAANRTNARRSTGPRTPEGHAAVRHNALTHGVLAAAIIPEALSPYESQEEFDAFLKDISAVLGPANALEDVLVEQIAAIWWRLARLYRAEAGAIAGRRSAIPGDLAWAEAWAERSPSPTAADDRIRRELRDLREAMSDDVALRFYFHDREPDHALDNDDKLRSLAEERLCRLNDTLNALARHREDIQKASRSLPAADTALKYARYETALQNQCERALRRLERLQRTRAGETVTAPLQLDVTGLTSSEG